MTIIVDISRSSRFGDCPIEGHEIKEVLPGPTNLYSKWVKEFDSFEDAMLWIKQIADQYDQFVLMFGAGGRLKEIEIYDSYRE